MRSFLFVSLFWLSTGLVALPQQATFFKRGKIQLPNTDVKTGLIWPIMGGFSDHDSSEYIFFRKNEKDLPLKYYPDEIVSFEFISGPRRFISVSFTDDSIKVRRFAEILFEGKYKLLLVTINKNTLYYIFDPQGNMTRLENTYDLPSASNNFSIVYHYEYKEALSGLFKSNPEMLADVGNLRFRSKDITSFLQSYHIRNNLNFNRYPPPVASGYAGASAGASVLTTQNIPGERLTYSPFATASLNFMLKSYDGPMFSTIGIRALAGKLHYDYQSEDPSASHISVYLEETITATLLNIDLSLGANLFRIGQYTPYISAGGGLILFAGHVSNSITEVYNRTENIVYTTLTKDSSKPKGFGSLMIEAGTNYNLKSGARIKGSLYYNRFLDPAKNFKEGFGISVSYFHKVF